MVSTYGQSNLDFMIDFFLIFSKYTFSLVVD